MAVWENEYPEYLTVISALTRIKNPISFKLFNISSGCNDLIFNSNKIDDACLYSFDFS